MKVRVIGPRDEASIVFELYSTLCHKAEFEDVTFAIVEKDYRSSMLNYKAIDETNILVAVSTEVGPSGRPSTDWDVDAVTFGAVMHALDHDKNVVIYHGQRDSEIINQITQAYENYHGMGSLNA